MMGLPPMKKGIQHLKAQIPNMPINHKFMKLLVKRFWTTPGKGTIAVYLLTARLVREKVIVW
jgi:hypothetical protein